MHGEFTKCKYEDIYFGTEGIYLYDANCTSSAKILYESLFEKNKVYNVTKTDGYLLSIMKEKFTK